MNKKIIGGIVVLVALVVIFAVWIGSKNNSVEYQSLVKEKDAVMIADQKPNSEETVVQYAKLSKPGYIVIYGQNSNGQKGEVLGVSDYLPAGEYTNVVVKRRSGSGGSSSNKQKTNSQTQTQTESQMDVENETVLAQIVEDDGDQVFTEDSDAVVVDESGNPVESDATLDENAETIDTQDEFIAELEDEGYTVDTDAADDLDLDLAATTSESVNTTPESF